MALSPGHYSFTSPTTGRSLTYIVRGGHHNHTSDDASSSNSLILVQCPGWGLGSSYLQAGLSPLERHFTLLYLHPRGTCGSSRPDNEEEMDSLSMAGDIELLREYLGLERFAAVLGHSNGGTIALGYAERFPGRLEKLVLVSHRVLGLEAGKEVEEEKDTGENEDAGESERIPIDLSSITNQELTAAWGKALPRNFFDPATFLPKFKSAMGDHLINAWCLVKQKKYDHQPRVGKWMLDHLRDVKAEVLCISGKQDVVCPIPNAEVTKRDIEHAEVMLLEGCGHFPFIEKEVETLDGIIAFLKA